MMRIPESFEGLLSDLVVGRRVHQKHAEKHNMTGNATSLCIVDFNSQFWSHLRLFHIEETMPNIISSRNYNAIAR